MVATFSLYEINNPLNNSMGVTFKLPVFTANRNRTTRATAVMEKDKIIFSLLTTSVLLVNTFFHKHYCVFYESSPYSIGCNSSKASG